jgi:histidinol-phosphate aminotransferase
VSGDFPIEPRPGILGIEPYKGGESRLEGRTDVVKLSSNEGALGPSPRAVAAIKAAAAEAGRYPDGSCAELRAAIGARFGLDPARIICGAGSDEILGLLSRAYAGPGDEVLYTTHGFAMYPICAQAVGAEPIAVPETDLTADVDALIAAAGNRTRLVYIANPNNPTGTYLNGAALRRLRAGLHDGVVLAIDAAYAEFVTEADYETGAALVDETDNTIMTRTFSKIFGLGNLRLGWAYGPPHMIDVLNRLRMPFNVSGIAQAAGVAALADTGHTETAIAHNTTERARLAAGLQAAGVIVPPSACNFVLARFPGGVGQAEAADAYLRGRGLIVRRMGGYGLPDSLRITVGLTQEMDAVIAAVTDFMAEQGAGNG